MKRILLVSLAVMLIGTFAYAVETESLRTKAIGTDLAFIVQDEYTDMMIAPYNILNLEGSRLYTSLTNITPGEEILIGGVLPVVGKLGLIGSNLSSLSAEWIYSDPWTPIGEKGEYEEIDDQSMVPADTYDREYGKADKKTGEINLVALYGYKVRDNLSLGLRIGYEANKIEPSNEYSLEDNNDVSAGDNYRKQTFTRSGKGEKDPITEQPIPEETRIAVGPAGKLQVNDELSIGAELSVVIAKGEFEENMTGTNYATAAYTGNQVYDWVGTISESYKPKGTGIGGAVNVEYGLNKETTLRVRGKYMSVPLSGDYAFEDIDNEKNDGFGVATKIVISSSGDIDLKSNEMSVAAGIEKKLNDDLMLGFGVAYKTDKEEISIDTTRSITVNDTVVDREDMKIEMKDKTASIILPFGLEYQANDWLALRAGFSHQIVTTETEYKETRTDKDPDGVVEDINTDLGKAKDTTRTTTFSYGVGLKCTENLQLDLLAIGDTFNVASNWRLSATLKF